MINGNTEKPADLCDCGSYLSVRVLVPWTFENAKALIDFIKREASARGYRRILLDLTFWEKPSQELTRFRSGEYLALQLKSPFKVAAFAHPQAINKFGENAAVNRAADFRIFPDERSAVEWLSKAN